MQQILSGAFFLSVNNGINGVVAHQYWISEHYNLKWS